MPSIAFTARGLRGRTRPPAGRASAPRRNREIAGIRCGVYVQAFPGPVGKSQISTGGGTEPRWSPKGDELFYRNGDRMMAVSVTTQPAFSAGAPRVLFEGRFARLGWAQANYDVSPDGRRFLMIQGDDPALPTSLRLITNWFTELASRAPGAR